MLCLLLITCVKKCNSKHRDFKTIFMASLNNKYEEENLREQLKRCLKKDLLQLFIKKLVKISLIVNKKSWRECWWIFARHPEPD